MNQENTGGVRCHDADACAMGQKPCPTPRACGCDAQCAVKDGTHKPAQAVHQIDEPAASAKNMQPGDDLHLSLLMAPHGLNLVVGQDRVRLLAYARDVWNAAQRAAAAPQAVQAAAPTDDELVQMWIAAGGEFFGPKTPTGSMPESKLFPFLRKLAATQPAAQEVDAQDAARWRMITLIEREILTHPNNRSAPEVVGTYMKAVQEGLSFQAAVDAAIAAQAKQGGA